MSFLTIQMSFLTSQVSFRTSQVSFLTTQMSCLTIPMSFLAIHTSFLTIPMSFLTIYSQVIKCGVLLKETFEAQDLPDGQRCAPALWVVPHKALRGGIPCSFLEPFARSWSHF